MSILIRSLFQKVVIWHSLAIRVIFMPLIKRERKVKLF